MRVLCPVFFPGWSESNRARDFKNIMERHKIHVHTFPFYSKVDTPWDEYDVNYIKLGPPTLDPNFFTPEILSNSVNHVAAMFEGPLPGSHTIIAPNQRYFDMNSEGIYGIPIKYHRIPIDTQLFRPLKKPYENKDLIVGWAGNVDNWRKHFPIVQSLEYLDGVTIVCAATAKLNDPGIKNETMRHYYSMVDIVIQTSESEGSGTIVLEGAACGKAIVGFDVGVTPEIVREGKGGICVKMSGNAPSKEEVEKIREAVMYMEVNKDFVREAGESNRKYMEEEWNQIPDWIQTLKEASHG